MPKCNLCGIDFEVNQVKRLQEGDTAILICNDCEHELQGALASKSDAKRYLAQLEKNPIIEQEQEEILVSFIEKHGSVFRCKSSRIIIYLRLQLSLLNIKLTPKKYLKPSQMKSCRVLELWN